MAERQQSQKENSLLFSLKELRQIEDERVKQEEEAERARLEAERQARETAERLAREEAERKRREEEDRVLRLQADKEKQLREEQLRLEAEKHRAQVDAAARLEEARIQADMHVKAASKKTPVGLIVGIIGAVIAMAGGVLAYVLLVVLPARELAAQQERDREIAKITAQFNNQQEALKRQQADLERKLEQTTDQAEKDRIKAALAKAHADEMESRRQMEDVKRRSSSKAKPGGAAKPAGGSKPACDPNDPLCGAGELK